MTADLILPIAKWKTVQETELRIHLTNNLKVIFEAMLDSAVLLGECDTGDQIKEEIWIALQKFIAA